jgi:hypothetical protein
MDWSGLVESSAVTVVVTSTGEITGYPIVTRHPKPHEHKLLGARQQMGLVTKRNTQNKWGGQLKLLTASVPFVHDVASAMAYLIQPLEYTCMN